MNFDKFLNNEIEKIANIKGGGDDTNTPYDPIILDLPGSGTIDIDKNSKGRK